MTDYLVTVLKENKRLEEKKKKKKGALKYYYMHDFGGQAWRLGKERMHWPFKNQGPVMPTILESATHLEHFNKGLGDKIDSFLSETIRGTWVSIPDMQDESKVGQKQT